jgi:hypothetical protein
MDIFTVFGGIQIIGCAIFAFIPFDRRRVRARWANCTIGICSVIGIARGVGDLAIGFGWLEFGSQAYRLLDCNYYLTGGLLLGFLFSLIFSGQLIGKKRDTNHPPNTALEPTPTAP